MTPDLILPILARWAHVIAAIIPVGGAIFIRFVLLPSAESVLDDETHDKLRTTMWRRWQLMVHVSIGFLIISGFYNYLVVMRPLHEDQPLYHALFGIKFLIALVVFLLAILLTSRKKYSERFRNNARFWMGILVTCALIVVMISGVMKNLPRTNGHATAVVEAVEE